MFSSFFGKKRSSPVEDNEEPPIPGAKPGEDFVVVNPNPPQIGGLYPSIGGAGSPYNPYPQRPAPPTPIRKMNSTEHNFHYLQGVPFVMCKELRLASNNDGFAISIGDVLAFGTHKVNLDDYNYDFTAEENVLKEYSH